MFLDAPKLTASGGVVGVMGLGGAADEHRAIAKPGNVRRGVSLAPITACLGLAVRAKILVVDRTLGVPNCAAVILV